MIVLVKQYSIYVFKDTRQEIHHDRSMPCPAKGGGQPGTPCATGPEGFIKEMNFWDVHGMVAEELPSWQRRWGGSKTTVFINFIEQLLIDRGMGMVIYYISS
jgi:hypothetical protein